MKIFAVTLLVAGLVFGFASMWWWALVGMSEAVGTASVMTATTVTTVGMLLAMVVTVE